MERKDENEPYRIMSIPGMFENWFLDYASYVILERAIPEVNDGLKPVQRRILHSMRDLDDGRYNKVANIVGHTMQYHPHGDASIGDALVQLGQKDLLIDCQGNWGNILTGDPASASRYIEARLSDFAIEVVFNPKTTNWKSSYDGRKKEPIALPMKFPLLLAQGADGIAVGLSTKILPHNFNELIDASIKVLKDESFELYPDFLTSGMIDVSNYNDGARGGKVRLRARISQLDKKTLVITEIPYSTTTGSIIESIIKANDKGKIKIKKVEDNTAENVEILIHLQTGVSPDTTIDALYAFTDCQISISPNACVIIDNRPDFSNVSDILTHTVYSTKNLLKMELEIRMAELLENWHYTSLEKIFFEQRIYRELEKDVENWDAVYTLIEEAFVPFIGRLKREINREDIIKLTEKPVRKISKFDVKKAIDQIIAYEEEISTIKENLGSLVEYTIAYYVHIKKKYGKDWERKTEIRSFETIQATMVAATNQKLYLNREEGFIGTGNSMKRDEFVCECSDIDDIINFREDGNLLVTKAAEKIFIGKNIIYANVFKKNDDRTIYNVIYRDGKDGNVFVKRFAAKGITRDKAYDITQGKPASKILYFTANPNGEAEVVKITLKDKAKLKRKVFTFDFKTLSVKGRASMGNILSRNPVKKIVLEDEGVSTLGARKIWYDEAVKRLSATERGLLLGEFKGGDRILSIMDSGAYKLSNFDLTNHFEADMSFIGKHYVDRIITAVYLDKATKLWYIKRFNIEESDRRMEFIELDSSNFMNYNTEFYPRLKIIFDTRLNKKEIADIEIDITEFIGIKGFKAKGKRLSNYFIKKIIWVQPILESPNYEVLSQQRLVEELISDDKEEFDEENTSGKQYLDNAEDNGKEQLKLF